MTWQTFPTGFTVNDVIMSLIPWRYQTEHSLRWIYHWNVRSSLRDNLIGSRNHRYNARQLCLVIIPWLILGLRPANERRRYFITKSRIGWAQNCNQPCNTIHKNIIMYVINNVPTTTLSILTFRISACDKIKNISTKCITKTSWSVIYRGRAGLLLLYIFIMIVISSEIDEEGVDKMSIYWASLLLKSP